MPIYTYRCDACHRATDEFNTIDARHDAPPCPSCGEARHMEIQPVRGSVARDCHYICPATGEKITSWKQRGEVMARAGLIDARDMNPAFVKRESDAALAENNRIAAGMDLPEEIRGDCNAILSDMVADRVAQQSH